MQRFIHLGMFPVAPFPQNDHCILPSAEADKVYLDYGPMFTAMRGRKWCLLPNVIQVDQGVAKANLFTVPKGYVVAVTLGGAATSSSLTLRDLPEVVAGNKLKCSVIHPGETEWKDCTLRQRGSTVSLKVPLSRGCAMVRLMA
jgi:hypothetical protein